MPDHWTGGHAESKAKYPATTYLTFVTVPVRSMVISLAAGGMSDVVILPPGQRISIWLGASGELMTCTALSWDQ